MVFNDNFLKKAIKVTSNIPRLAGTTGAVLTQFIRGSPLVTGAAVGTIIGGGLVVAQQIGKRRKTIRVKGGNMRTMLLKTDVANISSKGKVKKADIKNVQETPQNRFLARQNRLLKGAIIETSIGKARITNRPTQEGHVNAILIEE